MSKEIEEQWLRHAREGIKLNADGKHKEAIEALNKSIALNKNSDTYKALGVALFRIEKYYAAIEAFNKSIALNEYWDAYQGLGLALLHTENHVNAIEAFNKSIALNEHCNTYHGLGWALLRTENHEASIEAFNKSIDLYENWSSYQGLGWAFFHSNNYQAAIEAFNKSNILHEHWYTCLGLGSAFLSTTKYPAAIAEFNRSIQLHEQWDTYQSLGLALIHTKDYPRAIEAFNKSIHLHEQWDTYQSLGLALFYSKEYPAAIKAFNKSINLHGHWETYQHLGLALFHTKDYRKALDAMIESLAISRSEAIEKNLYEIFLRATYEGCVDDKFKPFLECDDSLKEDFLKEYILTRTKLFKIDPLILRQASFSIRKEEVIETINPTDKEMLGSLREWIYSKGKDTSILSDFPRYVFGTSHSKLHITSPNTTVIQCGPGTMFSIGDPGSRTKHFQKISSAVQAINPKKSVLIFEFGEIDIRNHIFRISKKKSQSIYEASSISVNRYIEFVKTIHKKGFNVLIIGPHCGGGKNISRASAVERNDLCAYINDILSLECQKNGFYFTTLFDKAVDQKTLKEVPCLYCDNYHLCLPPSAIGYALNTLINKRINTALSRPILKPDLFQKEEIYAECRILVSDTAGWQTGATFKPGETTLTRKGEDLKISISTLVIELPFLINPKEVILEFKRPINKIQTMVLGIQESWDIAKETASLNILHAHSNHNWIFSQSNLSVHSFNAPQNIQEQFCRYLMIQISGNIKGNYLNTIKIKRWIPSSILAICSPIKS